MRDVCITCGREHEPEVWGSDCTCKEPNVVHRQQCNGCQKIIGYVIDDDYCSPEKLYCSTCVDICGETSQ